MNIQAILLALYLGAGHRIVTTQTRSGQLYKDCQFEYANPFSGVICFWVGNRLVKVAAADVAVIHVSDLAEGPLLWFDKNLLERVA